MEFSVMWLGEHFMFLGVSDAGSFYPVRYNPLLITLSVGIAIFAAYAALDISEQITGMPAGGRRMRWLASGGLALGGGVWAMHFTGMLAFAIPCDVHYDWFVTAVSMLPGIVASIFALAVISRRKLSTVHLIGAGTLVGTGIGTMHYTGMAALRMNALLRYDVKLFLLSLVVAVMLACTALMVKFSFARGSTAPSFQIKLSSAVVMGLAISGMHYTAMAAARFMPDGDPSLQPTEGFHRELLAEPVLMLSALLLVLAISTSYARSLRTAAERYRIVADHTYAWETWLDENGKYLYVSPSAMSVTGYAAEEFIKDIGLLCRIIHPKDRERFACQTNEPDGGIQQLSFRIFHKAGHVVWLEHHSRPVYGDDGRYLGQRGSNHDITVLKMAKQAMQMESEKNLALLRNASDGIHILDEEGDLVEASDSFCAMLGYSREEMIGMNLSQWVSGVAGSGV